MSFVTGTTVQTTDFTSVKDLKEIIKSGFYQITIANAMYYKGFAKASGNEFHQCRLTCKAKNTQTGEEGRLSFSIFLPSVELNHFCYFLNLKVGEQYGLPDPTRKEGVAKATGQAYGFDHFPTVEGLTCFVLLECEGLSTRQDGTNYGQFRVVSFTDSKGRSAFDCANNEPKPNDVILEFFKKLQDEAQPVQAQIAQAQAQQPITTQNPQAQAMYGLNTGAQNIYNQGFKGF